jgi:NAD(P)-dependent dehydrogenase (short-subunit alcohol dehydrogenase family)
MTTPVARVTSANKGIGFHVARKLGAAGFHVHVGSRDLTRGEAAVATLRKEGMSAQVLHLDVTSAASIAAAAAKVEASNGRLDVLVNNAGITSGSAPPSTLTIDVSKAADDAAAHESRGERAGRECQRGTKPGSPPP